MWISFQCKLGAKMGQFWMQINTIYIVFRLFTSSFAQASLVCNCMVIGSYRIGDSVCIHSGRNIRKERVSETTSHITKAIKKK